MRHIVHHGDCMEFLPELEGDIHCIFADPPDNIDLGYGEYQDKMPDAEYIQLLSKWVFQFAEIAFTTWVSFNAKWTIDMGVIAKDLQREFPGLEVTPCVQVFTFGQHNKHDFGNNHRPLWRFRWKAAPVYPKHVKVPSWRQLNGDKRAAKGGRVPGDVIATLAEKDGIIALLNEAKELGIGNVFDFPRVTGNSKQRCSWHPTQLHEDLVERCIKSCTKEGDLVVDPFAGTGTTLRVCKRIGRDCITYDVDRDYCERIVKENGLSLVY